jgi:hypothetical protein
LKSLLLDNRWKLLSALEALLVIADHRHRLHPQVRFMLKSAAVGMVVGEMVDQAVAVAALVIQEAMLLLALVVRPQSETYYGQFTHRLRLN